MTEIQKRKEIINSLKSNYGNRNKGIDKRVQYLKAMTILNLIVVIFCGGVVLCSIVLEPLGFEFFAWQKMGLLTIMSLSFFMKFPEEIFELKLLKHLKKIDTISEFNKIEKLNLELKGIIKRFNTKPKYNGLLIPLVVIVLGLGLFQVLSENLNPYWVYAKVPVILVFVIVLSRFYQFNKILSENISEVEKVLS